MSQYLSSAAVVIGALRVKNFVWLQHAIHKIGKDAKFQLCLHSMLPEILTFYILFCFLHIHSCTSIM